MFPSTSVPSARRLPSSIAAKSVSRQPSMTKIALAGHEAEHSVSIMRKPALGICIPQRPGTVAVKLTSIQFQMIVLRVAEYME